MCWGLLHFFVKLYLMLWRSGLHSIRHIPKTLFDILVPVAFFFLMTFSRKEYRDSRENTNIDLYPFIDKNFLTPPYGPKLNLVVAYSPLNPAFEKLFKKSNELIENKTLEYFGVETAEDLETLLKKNRSIIAGIQFNHPSNITATPVNLNFSLRFPAIMRWYNIPWPTDILYKEQAYYRFPRDTLDSDFYRKEGFLDLQFRIINAFQGEINSLSMGAKEFPNYPPNLNFDKFQFLVPPLILICFHYTYCNNICFIVVEKKKRSKEIMRLMGISNWIYWLSLYIQKMLMQVVSTSIIIGLMKIRLGNSKAVFENSNFCLLWLFMIVYCMCFTSLGFLLSVFFTEIKSAISISTVIWFLSFLPFIITHVGYTTLPDHWKIVSYILPNTAMGYGIKLICQLELMTDDGLDWSTLWNGLYPYDILSVGTIMCVMMCTSVVCLGIFIYIIPIFPGTHGLARPFFYLFTTDFWSRRRDNSHKESNKTTYVHETDVDISNFETESENRTPGIEVINLTKSFVKGKAIVRNVSLNIYKNEITVLCGPNGSGKSTLMLILTGIIKATSGMVFVDGYDIRKKTNLARKSMSFCPQQNVLLNELTVREHIFLYSLIKGSSRKTANAEIKKYSQQLQFGNELNVLASNLSIGTKRKLSVTLALCGHSQFVFLDQPTDSINPAERQLFSNVLLDAKKGRHILMTTHSSDEAEMLADRIVFMADGQLKCCGSSVFMKKRFGMYRLLCVKNEGCQSNATTSLLGRYFPGITIETETESQLSYLLSYNKANKFGRILEKLETLHTKLKLKSFSISVVTTEFAFRELNKDLETDESSEKSLHIEDNSEDKCLCGMVLIPCQILAMLKKRFLCGIRGWRSFMLYIMMVGILMIPIAFDLHLRSVMQRPDPPPFEMSLDSYENSHAFLHCTDEALSNEIKNRVKKEICKGYPEMFASSLNPLIELNSTELGSYWGKKFGVQKYRFDFLIGASLTTKRHTWVNTFSALHSFPISMKYYLVSRIYPAKNVTVINDPVRSDEVVYRASTEYANMEAFGIDFPIFIAIILSIASSAHILFYIEEKKCGAKIKQYVTGVNRTVFWITSIVWDLIISIVPILAIVLWLYLSERVYWSEINTLYIVALIIFMFNLAMLPIICLLSLMFFNPTTGVCVLMAINTFISVALFVNNYGVQFIYEPTTKQALSVIPTCALIECLTKLSMVGKRCRSQCDQICDNENLCEENPDCCPHFSFVWTDDDVKREIFVMAYTSMAALVILLAIEQEISKQLFAYVSNFLLRPISAIKKVQHDSDVCDDSDTNSTDELIGGDVIGDGEKMNSSLRQTKSEKLEKTVIMQTVSKYYGRRLAVARATFDIKVGECVGLIGTKEMGKTTIFKMLTGEQRIVYGKAYSFGLNLKWRTNLSNYFVGYCSQIDGLWDNMTVRETLSFFCLLRGIPFVHAVDMANNLNLSQYFVQKVSQLSGGNKQILSIVIALMGHPSVIFIDEATTCIDDNTKRNLWAILNKFRSAGKSILLASDCMEEYQALCTRFVLEDGTDSPDLPVIEQNSRCIEIIIESCLSEYKMNNNGIIEFMRNSFKEADLRSNSKNFLTYNVPYSQIMFSRLFTAFEKRKRNLYIENYFVSLK